MEEAIVDQVGYDNDDDQYTNFMQSSLNIFSPLSEESEFPQSQQLQSLTEKNIMRIKIEYNYTGDEILASYGYEDVYLFSNKPIKHPGDYLKHRYLVPPCRFFNSATFFGPKSEYVLYGDSRGFIYIWDKVTEEIIVRLKYRWSLSDSISAQCHPSMPVLATGGHRNEILIWMPNPRNDDAHPK